MAISQNPARDWLKDVQNGRETPKPTPEEAEEMRIRTFEAEVAITDLTKLGREAWPQLLQHLTDMRKSVPVSRTTMHRVGLACYSVIERNLLDLGNGYRAAFPLMRKGADGEYQVRPYYCDHPLFNIGSIDAWLKQREEKSLPEIQLEILQWYLAEEKKIGFATKDEEANITGPMLQKQKELEAEIQKARATR